MILFGNFVFVKGDKREKDGRVYCNVTVECVEDESVEEMACEPDVLSKLKKYNKYQMVVSTRKSTWDGVTRERKIVTDVKPL